MSGDEYADLPWWQKVIGWYCIGCIGACTLLLTLGICQLIWGVVA
jgi:hypothetical protein